MYVTIKNVDNGFIMDETLDDINSKHGLYTRRIVFEYPEEANDEDQTEKFAELLRHLSMQYGPTTSRYSNKRIYVVIAPGDKNGSFTEAHSNVIWPELNLKGE